MAAALAPTPGWQAHLRLGLDAPPRPLHATRLFLCRHSGPLRVQRPFYPEPDGGCHVYLLHPPGGVVGGDQLTVDVELRPRARALLTTPAAGKVYRSAGRRSQQMQRLQAAPGAVLEWLPQETIVFDGALSDTLTRLDADPDSRFCVWDILCLGRPAAGELFRRGDCRQRLELWRDGRPLLLETARFGDRFAAAAGAAWGLRDQPVSATLICSAGDRNAVLLDRLRAELNDTGQANHTAANRELQSVTLLSNADGPNHTRTIVCRYLGPSATRARALFTRLWGCWRRAELGKPPCPPRVWAV